LITRINCGGISLPSGSVRPVEKTIADQAQQVMRNLAGLFDDFQFSRRTRSRHGPWLAALISTSWKTRRESGRKNDDASRRATRDHLYTSGKPLRIVTALAHAVVPDSTSRILAQLGLGDIHGFRLDNLAWGQLAAGTQLGKVEAVFPTRRQDCN